MQKYKTKRFNKTGKRLFAYFVMIGIVSVFIFATVFLTYICFFTREKANTQKMEINFVEDSTNFALQSEKEAEKPLVVIDAGHGGKDSGALAFDVYEKDINLSVAFILKGIFEENGIDVIMTRSRDDYIELSERCEIANNSDAQLFLSLHCNSYDKDDSVAGFELYYEKDDLKSRKYADSILKSAESCEVSTRSVKTGDYYVLINTDIPAVLIEMGFITNSDDRNMLQSRDYQSVLCESIFEGVSELLQT